MNDREATLLLGYHPRLGARTIAKLKQVSPLAGLVKMPKEELIDLGIPQQTVEAILEIRQSHTIDAISQELKKYSIKYTILGDRDYPALLGEIPDAPAVIFYKGSLLSLDAPTIGIVGSRKMTDYGKRVTDEVVSCLGRYNITVISGLALGIDGAAHKQALKAKTKTVAVLGNGLSSIYPVSHIKLGKEIIDSGGALISEFPPATPAYPGNFPMRNRIIAGLSKAILIIEAAKKSGSLLTAKAALEYNREVLTIPHNWYSQSGEGPNQLIRMGATAITKPEHVLEAIGIFAEVIDKKEIVLASSGESAIFKCLSDIPIHIDDLILQTNLPALEINAIITLMEMKQIVRHVGGNRYVKGS